VHDFGTCKENAAVQWRLPILRRVWPQNSSRFGRGPPKLIHTHTYIYVYICIYVYIYIDMFVNVYIWVHIYTDFIHVYVYI